MTTSVNENNRVECLVLFGAGASKGNGDCFPEVPPLGSELLDSLHKFDPILWPTPNNVTNSDKLPLQAPFEVWMDENVRIGFNIVPYQKGLAIFFSRFITSSDDNCYNRIIRATKGELMGGKIVLATLNYDLLLDRALSRELGYVNYDSIGKPPYLIKVHGSCNWLVEHHKLNIKDEFRHELKGSEYGKFDFPPLCVFDDPNTMERKIREDKIPPIMRIFASSKPFPTGKTWLMKQENRFQTTIQQADKIIVIGARPNEYDDHIWGEILKTPASVAMVAPDPFSREWLKKRDNKKDVWIDARFEDSWKKIVRMIKRGWENQSS